MYIIYILFQCPKNAISKNKCMINSKFCDTNVHGRKLNDQNTMINLFITFLW